MTFRCAGSTQQLVLDSQGDVSMGGNLTIDGNLTANKYIVSSSVTYMTQSFSSGSTMFGDSIDDTHIFTGSILLDQTYRDQDNVLITKTMLADSNKRRVNK